MLLDVAESLLLFKFATAKLHNLHCLDHSVHSDSKVPQQLLESLVALS